MPATLSDVARESSVAVSTAADILRGRPGYAADTRRRVAETAQRMGFVHNHFARSLQTKRSHTVGVVSNFGLSGVTGATLKAISDSLLDKGYMPLVCEGGMNVTGVERALKALRARFVDGVIVESDDDASVARILPPGTPFAMIRNAPCEGAPSVCADRRGAFAYGVQWLAERGHRRIAFLGVENAEALQNPLNSHALKIAGYRDEMKQRGLEDPSLLLDLPNDLGAAREFVLRNPALFRGLTAVLACSDRVALEVITALCELGVRVPEECSVIGFDDTEYVMSSRPRLTSFNPRRAEVGARAVEMILKA
jgi:LacI family transcriptional regulator